MAVLNGVDTRDLGKLIFSNVVGVLVAVYDALAWAENTEPPPTSPAADAAPHSEGGLGDKAGETPAVREENIPRPSATPFKGGIVDGHGQARTNTDHVLDAAAMVPQVVGLVRRPVKRSVNRDSQGVAFRVCAQCGRELGKTAFPKGGGDVCRYCLKPGVKRPKKATSAAAVRPPLQMGTKTSVVGECVQCGFTDMLDGHGLCVSCSVNKGAKQ